MAKRRRRGGSRGRPRPPDPVILLGRGNSMGKIRNQFSSSKSTRRRPWKSTIAARPFLSLSHRRRCSGYTARCYYYLLLLLLWRSFCITYIIILFQSARQSPNDLRRIFLLRLFFFHSFDFCYAAEYSSDYRRCNHLSRGRLYIIFYKRRRGYA